MAVEYAIIVKNMTRLEMLTKRFNTKAQTKFYIERRGGHFEDYEEENDIFYQSLAAVQNKLDKFLKYKIVDRSFLPSYLFSDKNVILVLGQDGLVANTAKYAHGIPLVAINPDKKRYDGVLLPFDIDNFRYGVETVVQNSYHSRKFRFAEASLNDGQRLLAFNDLFIGASSHISARYRIRYGNQEEEQSSSGIIVSTHAGSTGWLSSVFNMAYGVVGLFEKDLCKKTPRLKDDQLLFAVREPFRTIRTGTDICVGSINVQNTLVLESLMPAKGVIFSDGVESDFLPFNSGAVVTIGLAPEYATLVLPG